MMKRFIPYWLSALLCCCALLPVACSKDDEGVTGSGSTMNPFAPKTDTEEDEDPLVQSVGLEIPVRLLTIGFWLSGRHR